jgi:hypothetical protein
MDGEGRIPPGLVAVIAFLVLAVGAAAYYAGRFGHSSRRAPSANADLPGPAAPAPAMVEKISTPADVPPMVTPPIPVVVEKTSRPHRLVEKSSEIVLPVPPASIPTARPISPGEASGGGRQILVEIPPTSRPTPTRTVPELERPAEPPREQTPVALPPPEETPEPEPTVRPGDSISANEEDRACAD